MNVYILLDRSGSMQNLWEEAAGLKTTTNKNNVKGAK